MRQRPGAPRALEPVLVEEGGERRLAELDFPQDAQQRGHRLLALARQTEYCRRRLGRVALAGLGAGAEAEIDASPARRRRELEMRRLMQQDIGLCVAARACAVPAEIFAWAAGPQPHAQAGEQTVSRAAMRPCQRRGGAIDPRWRCDAAKHRASD